MSSFRRMNVDANDDDEDLLASEATANNQEQARSSSVKSLLSRGDLQGALKAAIENPPLGNSNPSLKVRNLAVVVGVLNAVKPSEVNNLEQLDCETICKYVYKGMESPETYNTSSLLAWHEKLVEVFGIGLLVRVISDSKTA